MTSAGVSPRAFDGRGNYTLGVREQIIFPEIDYDEVDQTRGLDITITTNRCTDEESFALLEALGMPFAKDGRQHGRDTELGSTMAKTSQRVRQQRTPKFKTRGYTRCRRCGRSRSVYRKFGVCRICLRELAHNGYIPGMTKSSW